MNKVLWGILILAGISFGSYKLGQKNAPVEVNPNQIEEKLKEGLVELTLRDFKEYQNLKTLEERYKKADEILGKVVTLFLADLGLRLGYKPIPAADLGNTCPQISPSAPCPPPQTPPVVESPRPTPKQTPQWIRDERRILGLNNEEDALRAAKKAEIPDFFSAVQGAHSIDLRDANLISGHFIGDIIFLDKKRYPTDWNIEWDIQLKPGSKVLGNTRIVITKKTNGSIVYQVKSNSPASNFRRISGSQSLIVDINDEGYLQIYPLGGSRVWVGNYYDKISLGSYKMVGQVRLTRVD